MSGGHRLSDPSPGAPHPLNTQPDIVLVGWQGGAQAPDLDWPSVLGRAVTFAEWPETEKLDGLYVFGLAAYDAWAATLRHTMDHNGAQTDALMTEYLTRVIADARSSASLVLQSNAELHPAFGDAARYYMAEAEVLKSMPYVLCQQGQGLPWAQRQEGMTASFPRQDVREQAAQVVDQAKQLDEMALDALRTALADLEGRPPGPAPTAPDVEEHVRRGRDLKARRQYAEAAQELRAAIRADPKHVEAHWVLGWTLIELKNNEGAKQAFGKVIELAPGTVKAQEAEKAIQRLGG